MTRVLSELLGAREPMFRRSIEKLEQASGHGSADVRLSVELSQGVHRFGVNTDDGYKLTFGTSPSDQSTTPIAFHSGGPANETFDVVVPAAGLYPFRLVWYERGGGAHAEFTSVNPQTGAKTLINDSAVPTAIKAFATISAPSVRVESSANVASGYAVDNTAVVNAAAGTITIPMTAQNRSFRINGTVSHRITGVQVSGNSLVLNFQAAN